MKWPKGKRLSVLWVTAEALEATGRGLGGCPDLARFGRRFPDGLPFTGKSFIAAHDFLASTATFDAFLTPLGRARFWSLWASTGRDAWESGKTTVPAWNFRTFSKLIREGYLSRKGYRLLTARRQKEGE